MSEVYKCDRCGKIFETRKKRTYTVIKDYKMLGVKPTNLDLCDTCDTDLCNWWISDPQSVVDDFMEEAKSIASENLCEGSYKDMCRVFKAVTTGEPYGESEDSDEEKDTK